jgi:hypothetical protein
MTAIPKPHVSRFSDDEIADIINTTRQRSTVTRDTGPEHDRIDVAITYMPDSAYRFERDASGWTYFILKSHDELKLVIAGTLDECLLPIKQFRP